MRLLSFAMGVKMDSSMVYSDDPIDQSLFSTLVKQLKTTPLDSISVTSLSREAHVSRAEFYRRYADKYDLLNSAYERILNDTLFTVNSGASWREAVWLIYAVIGTNAEFFRAAFESKDRNSLHNFIFERTLKLESEILASHSVDVEDPLVSYRLRAYVAGGLQLTIDWVREGANMPLDDLVNILVEMVPQPFRPYFS